jgi:hypothetical protein
VTHNAWEEAQLEFVGSITAPLFWVFRDSTGKDEIKNGSLFFMDAGEGVFAVTAAHVVEACLRDSVSPVFQCMIGGNGPDRTVYLQRKNERAETINRLCDRIIAAHQGMDIATLRVRREEIELANRKILTSLEGSWPPNLAEIGAVACCGCPGEGRWRLAQDELSFGFMPIGAFATSVHETCISIQIEREKCRPIFGNGIPENYDFGGMSGGPVIEILQTSSGQFWRRPAGVIFQGPNPSDDASESIQGLEIIRARPVHFINRNGSLDVARWEQSNG